jgi:hypothetical protein
MVCSPSRRTMKSQAGHSAMASTGMEVAWTPPKTMKQSGSTSRIIDAVRNTWSAVGVNSGL